MLYGKSHKKLAFHPKVYKINLYFLLESVIYLFEFCSNFFKGYFYAFKAVDFIFRAADRAKVSREAKYMAMTLFNQFLMRHIVSLYQYVVESSSKSVKQDWEKVEAKVSNQLPLRAASCIQICAKVTGTPTLAVIQL